MPPDLPNLPQTEAQIIEMTNGVRSQEKLGPLKPDPKLAAAARAYAAYLAKSGAFSHEADGRQAGDRITAAGYEWCQVGENLALAQSSRGFSSRDLAAKAVEGWLNSPGHRENLMQPHVTDIGVAIAKAPDNDPKYISVQLFGRPKSMMYEFQVSNATPQNVTYSFAGERHEVKPSFAVTMSACVPSALVFERIGSGAKSKPLSVRHLAGDGLVYVLKSDAATGFKVEITSKQRVK